MAILAIRGLKLVIQIDEHMGAEAGDTWCFRCVCRCFYEGRYISRTGRDALHIQ